VDTLQRQVRRANRRLIFQRFLDLLAWCWCATLAAVFVLIVVDRFWPLGILPWVWAAAALAVGLLAAVAWTFHGRATSLEAAIELDRRFALKERVSSALALSEADRRTEAGEALVADAVRRVERIEVAGKFAVKPPRRLLLPLLPGIAAILVALLIAPAAIEQPTAAKADDTAVSEQVKKKTETVHRQLAERREQAKKEGLQDAERLFLKLEEGAKELKNEPTKEKALTKINDLSRALADRRRQLGGAEKTKDEFKQLNDKGQTPADKFAKAVNRGDFAKAAEELKNLKNELEKGKLDEKQKADLANQIDQMKEQLDKQVQAGREAQHDLEQRAEQLRKSGQLAEANKLEEQLAKLREKLPQLDQMNDMAKKLGQCSKCMHEGDCDGAGKKLGEMQAAMQQQIDEMEMLDDAEQKLAELKEEMNGGESENRGCDEPNGQPGSGIGTAVVRGVRNKSEKKNNAAFYDSQVKQKIGKGAATVVGLVEGKNSKGDYQQQIQQQVESVRRGTTDPLTGRHMPKKHGEHAKEYFDSLRQGK
jgi:hypothetical protein